MANTYTTNYGLTKPEVGADANAWGGHLNTDMDILDSALKAVSDTAAAALPKSGGTMSGAITFAGSQPTATTSTPGIVALNDTVGSTSTTTAATANAVTNVSNVANAALPKAGGTMTGALTLAADPSTNLQAATKQYVDTAASGSSTPSGAVMAFAMNSAPTGWLACNGAAISRTTYAALFAAIGITYGAGDGSTTFNLPDLRGYFVRGSGTNGDGTASGTFGAKQADAYLNHSHSITDPGHTHQYTAPAGSPLAAGSSGNAFTQTSTTTSSTTGITVNTSTTGGTETRPKNIALLYCIKA